MARAHKQHNLEIAKLRKLHHSSNILVSSEGMIMVKLDGLLIHNRHAALGFKVCIGSDKRDLLVDSLKRSTCEI